MAERGTPKPKPAPPLPPDAMPAELLAARTAAFLRMTQGPDKPTAYPAPTR